MKTSPKPKRRRTVFTIDAPGAKEVFLLGDFNGWNPLKHPMKKNKAAAWEKTVMLYPGRYEYKFLVDGRWMGDPANEQTCPNCFGTRNNVLDVSP